MSDPDLDALVPTSRFSWMEDAIDTVSFDVSQCVLPQRRREQAASIENYTPTLEAYKQSALPAYKSARSGAKRSRQDATDEETLASIVSPVFEKHRTDALGTTGNQVAHLLPHDTGCSIFYEAPTIGALGQEVTMNDGVEVPVRMTRIEKQSLIHGSRCGNALARLAQDARRKARRLRYLKPKKPATVSKAKVVHTGLKHCALNKIQLMEHGPYDKSPYMIIQPALSEEEVLDWTPGIKYAVICMVGEVASNLETLDYRARFSLCRDASSEHVSKAIETLGVFVKGLANSLKNMDDFEELVHIARRHDNLEDKELVPLRATRTQLLADPTILVPVFSMTKFNKSNVAIVNLKESIPDPYLLCTKAAVNWSNFNNQKLLPGCRYDYEDEESVESYTIQEPTDSIVELKGRDNVSDLDEDE